MLKSLVGYAAKMFAANTLTGLITFGVTMLAAKERTRAAMGDYVTYMTIYGFIQTALISGVNAVIQKFGAVDDEARLEIAATCYRLFFAFLWIFGVLAVGFGFWLGLPVALALAGSPWVVVTWWARYILRSRLDAGREARLMVIASLSNSLFQLLFLTFTPFDDALIYGDFAALVAGGVGGLLSIPRGVGAPFRKIMAVKLARPLVMEMLRFIFPLWVAGILSALANQIIAVWSRASLGPSILGGYGVMLQIWQFANKPMEIVGNAALPALVKETQDRRTLFLDLQRLCLVTFPAVAIAVAAGSPLLFRLMRMEDKWGEVPVLLMIQAVSVPVIALQMVVNQYTIAEGRPSAALVAMSVHLGVNVALLPPMTSFLGLHGAVASGNIAGAANALAFVSRMWRGFKEEMKTAMGWTALATFATAACLFPVFIYRDNYYSWILAFPAVAGYAVILYGLRMIRPYDFVRLKRAIRGRAS